MKGILNFLYSAGSSRLQNFNTQVIKVEQELVLFYQTVVALGLLANNANDNWTCAATSFLGLCLFLFWEVEAGVLACAKLTAIKGCLSLSWEVEAGALEVNVPHSTQMYMHILL
ncbi:hypothetical protein BT96DRAFT_946586 [Gymnopus androsaceus JB14]|uniref:Uncharacterized protein n=1 Tax=Gymnopus androsaceus JB14 TaxID=1447944 RepID=A0A6A4GWM3_9AGAR|nr:hypothetical protein BT96DRAFT_946586 [Gymnopus androsaceus JB14]